MNKVIELGRIVRKPEVRYNNNGKAVCQFTIAVDRDFAGKDGKKEADFIPVVIWDKQGEAVGKYFDKGQRILIEGRLQVRSYDANDGTKRYVTEVVANHFEFIEKKNTSNFDSFGSEEIPFDE